MINNELQLSEIFYRGCKSEEKFKIGFEFEKLAVNSSNFQAVPYFGEKSISEFLQRFKLYDKTEELYSDGNLLGLRGMSKIISLEPGCQTEISTNPYKKISDIAAEIQEHNFKTAIIGEEFGIKWIGYGIQPISTYEDIKIIPKKRYEIMTEYLPKRGSKALVMMRETAGMQTSIDYSSEEDAMLKLKVALAISPILTAMFSNSPIRVGKDTGYKSFRASSWLKTDENRCGLISKKIFEEGFGFADYTDYLLDVPMFCIERNDETHKATHLTFRKFIKNGLDGYLADSHDWELHVTTVFPEARLKNFIEVRNCDSQKSNMILAFPTLIKGIFYDKSALNQVWDLVNKLKWAQIQTLRTEVPKLGMKTVVNKIKISDLAKEILAISELSLLKSENTAQEVRYLDKLKEYTKQGISPADVILQNWNGIWDKKVSKLVEFSELR